MSNDDLGSVRIAHRPRGEIMRTISLQGGPEHGYKMRVHDDPFPEVITLLGEDGHDHIYEYNPCVYNVEYRYRGEQ